MNEINLVLSLKDVLVNIFSFISLYSVMFYSPVMQPLWIGTLEVCLVGLCPALTEWMNLVCAYSWEESREHTMGGSEVKQGLPFRCSQVGAALPLATSMDRELCKLSPPLYTSSHTSFWPSKEKHPFLVEMWERRDYGSSRCFPLIRQTLGPDDWFHCYSIASLELCRGWKRVGCSWNWLKISLETDTVRSRCFGKVEFDFWKGALHRAFVRGEWAPDGSGGVCFPVPCPLKEGCPSLPFPRPPPSASNTTTYHTPLMAIPHCFTTSCPI